VIRGSRAGDATQHPAVVVAADVTDGVPVDPAAHLRRRSDHVGQHLPLRIRVAQQFVNRIGGPRVDSVNGIGLPGGSWTRTTLPPLPPHPRPVAALLT
jgi:hypothetical protein